MVKTQTNSILISVISRYYFGQTFPDSQFQIEVNLLIQLKAIESVKEIKEMGISSNIGTRNGFMAIGQTNVLYTQLAASGNQLFMIPKYAVKDLDSLEDNDSLRIELDRHCVYFMVGKKDDKPAIYVGQAGHRTTTKKTVIKRLAEHTRDGYAPYWDTAYILVPKHEDRWEPTHINYLEYLFTTNIDKTKYVDISGDRVNDHIPNKPEDRQDCEDSYNDGLIYLSKFNIKLFNPIDKKPLNTNVIKDIKVENKIIRKLRSSALTEKKTPHNIVNDMLDLLPWERFNKNTTFFDPVCKVGEFLEEIRLRLFDLEMSHGEFDERGIYAAEACWHHITYNQLFGFTISEEARSFTINTLYGEIGYDAPNIKYIEDYEDIVKDTGTNKITEDEIKQYIRLIVESSKREAVTSGELKDSVSRYMYKSSLYKDRTKEDKDAIKQEITARKKLLCYKAILQKELGNMKFDVVIGNPPIQ